MTPSGQRSTEKIVPTGDVDADVAAAVERIEQQKVIAARIRIRDRLAVLHLLRRTRRQMSAPGVGLEQHVVGDHVELLLRLALDVHALSSWGAHIPEHAAQCALADRDRDCLAGAGDDLDQQAQVRIDAAGALFLDEESCQRSGRHRDGTGGDGWIGHGAGVANGAPLSHAILVRLHMTRRVGLARWRTGHSIAGCKSACCKPGAAKAPRRVFRPPSAAAGCAPAGRSRR
jgi:hypothetical protein